MYQPSKHNSYNKAQSVGPAALFFLLLFASLPFLSVFGQGYTEETDFRVVSYNVENLFDCQHDSLKNDYEYLPQSTRRWTPHRYYQKLNNIARVLIAAGEGSPPELVALCEVENDSVLHGLTRRSLLRKAHYQYLMTHSADSRGIDVALLYRPMYFKPLQVEALQVPQPHPDFRPTRDILYVCGQLLDTDSLHVFVVHFPSRAGGTAASEPYRLAAAKVLADKVHAIQQHRADARILIAGDFNDYPQSASIRKVLQATIPPTDGSCASPNKLYHLLAAKAARQKSYGSYKFRGQWQLLDHLIVSGSLLHPSASLCTSTSQAEVIRLPFLLTPDKKYHGTQPFRTYSGMRYTGGYSDHLPVSAVFHLRY